MHLQERELQLRLEIEEILYLEELLWFQKSRSNWLSHGNRNTGYFHGCTLARRRRNKIKGLKVENDEWCFDDVASKYNVVHYFKGLFAIEYSVNGSLPRQACAIYEGLSIAWGKRFRQVELECDNTLLVETFIATRANSSKFINYLLKHLENKNSPYS
ncbi:hypothetical protein J1N35_021843 [Gossypium stocksii]|uniref:RNase H type-1 domain-containing protein n=1 Tax=Gossypium stocksii TaxID=47602 RepID=A0A9D3VGH7_9ROSI|nr:hypothetical protein J1N35_021843 [Gossypium stocksii]